MGRIHRRCARRLSEMAIPRPFDLVTFCAHVEKLRGRRLELKAVPGLAAVAPCGMWLSMAQTDYVIYEANTSKLHSEHIILHELAHMLCDHRLGMNTAALGTLLPNLNPAMVRRVLGRVNYVTEQEQEAETLASLIRGAGAPERSGDALSRLTEVFGPHN